MTITANIGERAERLAMLTAEQGGVAGGHSASCNQSGRLCRPLPSRDEKGGMPAGDMCKRHANVRSHPTLGTDQQRPARMPMRLK
jgi:hypothetical protein